jgi:hypothetical protein
MLSLSLGAGIATVACSSLSSGFPNVRCWFRLLGLFSDDIARFRHFLPCVFANVMAQKTAEKLQRTLTRHSFLKKHFPTVTLSETQSLFLSQFPNQRKSLKRIFTQAQLLQTTIKMSKFSLLLIALVAIIATSVSAQKPQRVRKLQTLSPVAVSLMTPVATPTTSSSSSSSSSSKSSKSSKRQLVHYNTEYEK